MKRFVLLLLSSAVILLSTPVAHAFSSAHLWSMRMGGASSDVGYDVAVDGVGNVYVAGSFQGTANFGGADLTSAGGTDIFLAKFDAYGSHEWSQRFGSTSTDEAFAVKVDASGNVLVTGQFTGTVNFGGVGLISAGQTDVFLAKYNSNGTHVWSARYGGANGDIGQDVGVDNAGNVFVTGTFQGSVSFGGVNLVSAGNLDIFLAKYNAANGHLWSVRFGGGLADYSLALAVDAPGNVIVTGAFQGTASFGPVNLVSVGQADVYYVKYNAAGVYQWSERFGGLSTEFGQSVATDGNGNIFATGIFLGTANFGGSNLMSLGGYDIFLAKYNAAGAHQWSHRYGDNINDYSQSIAVDFAGDVYANGYYEGSVDFGGGELTSFGGFDVYLAKYDTGGNHVWSRHGGGPLDELGASVAVDQFGVVITGYFNANANFGGAKLTSAGGFDAYLAKYSRGFAEPIIGSVEDIGNDQGGKVKILFSASGGDDAYASNPVSHYVAFRRDDPPPPGAIAPLTAAPSDPLLLAGWIQVGSVDAFVDDSYEIVVPTIGDSTIANGQYWSAFMIRAATGLPSVYYSSPPDSGYSLDNLAPGAPTNLVLAGGQLYWSGSSAPDFDYFTVYGSNTGHFADALVIGYTVANHLSVFGSPYPYYLVTATDFSGNESLPGSTADPTGVGGAPVSYVLSVTNFPNPFNPQTSIRYTVPSRGTVAVRIYDARGALVRTLFDGDRSAGAYSIEWNGRADNGDAVASGVYFVRIEQNGATRTKKMVMLK